MDQTYADFESVLDQMVNFQLNIAVEKEKRIKQDEEFETLQSELFLEREHVVKKREELVKLKKSCTEVEATCTYLLAANAELEKKIEELEAEISEEKEKSANQVEGLLNLQSSLDDVTQSWTLFAEMSTVDDTIIEALKSDLDRAETALKDEKEKVLCQICIEHPRNALCMPCRHFAYCVECLQDQMRQSKTCPTCRSPNLEIIECYI